MPRAATPAWVTYGATNQITPAPEPATYGAIFMGLSLVGLGVRRWRTLRPVARSRERERVDFWSIRIPGPVKLYCGPDECL